MNKIKVPVTAALSALMGWLGILTVPVFYHNAGINGGIGGGTVVYYCSSATARPPQAQRLYNAVTSRTGMVGNRSQKVIKYGFDVVKYTKMPAFLTENGFMDGRVDTPIILTPAHADRTAQGIVSFLTTELRLVAQGALQRPQTGGSTAPDRSVRKYILSGLYRPQNHPMGCHDGTGSGCQLYPPQADRQGQQYHRVYWHSRAKYPDLQSAGGRNFEKGVVAQVRLCNEKAKGYVYFAFSHFR